MGCAVLALCLIFLRPPFGGRAPACSAVLTSRRLLSRFCLFRRSLDVVDREPRKAERVWPVEEFDVGSKKCRNANIIPFVHSDNRNLSLVNMWYPAKEAVSLEHWDRIRVRRYRQHI